MGSGSCRGSQLVKVLRISGCWVLCFKWTMCDQLPRLREDHKSRGRGGLLWNGCCTLELSAVVMTHTGSAHHCADQHCIMDGEELLTADGCQGRGASFVSRSTTGKMPMFPGHGGTHH